jgi:hypothetical protein
MACYVCVKNKLEFTNNLYINQIMRGMNNMETQCINLKTFLK